MIIFNPALIKNTNWKIKCQKQSKKKKNSKFSSRQKKYFKSSWSKIFNEFKVQRESLNILCFRFDKSAKMILFVSDTYGSASHRINFQRKYFQNLATKPFFLFSSFQKTFDLFAFLFSQRIKSRLFRLARTVGNFLFTGNLI